MAAANASVRDRGLWGTPEARMYTGAAAGLAMGKEIPRRHAGHPVSQRRVIWVRSDAGPKEAPRATDSGH